MAVLYFFLVEVGILVRQQYWIQDAHSLELISTTTSQECNKFKWKVNEERMLLLDKVKFRYIVED